MKSLLKKIKSFFTNPDHKILKSKFKEIHDKNLFLGNESISGPGSDLLQTEIISKAIPELLVRHRMKTFIDAPCGDLYWMQHVRLNEVKYIGLDIVEELVKKNNQKFSQDNRSFLCKNIVIDSLPEADIVFIRDCWVHLSNEDVFKCIMNLKSSGIKYLLTTSFSDVTINKELTKIWRPLNLEIAPFNFPKPIEIINEGCRENDGKFKDKCIMLWDITTLPDFKVV